MASDNALYEYLKGTMYNILVLIVGLMFHSGITYLKCKQKNVAGCGANMMGIILFPVVYASIFQIYWLLRMNRTCPGVNSKVGSGTFIFMSIVLYMLFCSIMKSFLVTNKHVEDSAVTDTVEKKDKNEMIFQLVYLIYIVTMIIMLYRFKCNSSGFFG